MTSIQLRSRCGPAKGFAGVVLLGSFVMAQAATVENRFQHLADESFTSCERAPKAMCWKPAAEHLQRLNSARSELERRDQLLAYYMLAKTAHLVGDLAESAQFYTTTLDLAQSVAVDRLVMESMVKFDAAMLYLSMHDYVKALGFLDDTLIWFATFPVSGEASTSVSLLRAGALIGLNRNAEADIVLQGVLDTLNFDGTMPFEGWPVGPQPLDPFEAARRIAFHYQKVGKSEDALKLLQSLELRRLKVVPGKLLTDRMHQPWGSDLHPADILDDEAALYLAQGKDAAAEPLLLQSLALRETTAGIALRRTLNRLAALARRAGRATEADDFDSRAGLLKVNDSRQGVDPLADTLGLPN
jgi:tetratricopeptide (TPR) repeat protein